MIEFPNKIIIPSFLFLVWLLIGLICLEGTDDHDYSSIAETEEEAGPTPDDWNFQQRAYPFGKIDKKAFATAYYYRSQKEIQNKSNTQRGPLAEPWKFRGPTDVGGRVTDIEMSSDNPQLLFVGTASGGIFRSANLGATWTPIFDDAQSLSIGDMAIAPSNQQIIYAGTGEPNAGGGSVAYDGNGIYQSIDKGNTWIHMGLDSMGSTGRIVVHPADPNICYVGAMGFLFENNSERGVFKTQDGGQNWQKVLFINDSTGVIDLVIDPVNPEILYAAAWQRVRRIDYQEYGGPASGIYKTINGGASWIKLTGAFLPTAGRIGLAISASDPHILVAAVCDPIGGLQGIYKTIDAGDNWDPLDINDIGAPVFSYWFGRIYIHPQDPDVIFYTNLNMYKSVDGGSSWQATFPSAHADQHTLCFNPLNPETVLAGNDGGLYISYTGGKPSTKINTLPITQFYSCEIDNQVPKKIFGGAQDNGTVGTFNGSTEDWDMVYGGDGFRVRIDPVDNKYMYAEYQFGNLARSINGGVAFLTATTGISPSEQKNWNTPIELDPIHPSILYFGGQRVYKSINHAETWLPISPMLTDDHVNANIVYGTLTAISVSPVNTQIIYAGSDDGHLQLTLNGGNLWEDVSANLPDRWVTAIEADPLDANTAYVTFSGFRFGSNIAHIYKTIDLGQTWKDISGDLPDIPINDIVVTPHERNLYIATDVGVFYSINNGSNWELVGTGLPNTIISDISYHDGEQFILAATYGRGMYKIAAPEEPTAVIDNQNIKPFLQIYPNPASSLTTILLPSLSQNKYHVSIFDVNGKRVLEMTSLVKANEHISFDASTWKNGAYFVVVTDERGQLAGRTKLIKTE